LKSKRENLKIAEISPNLLTRTRNHDIIPLEKFF